LFITDYIFIFKNDQSVISIVLSTIDSIKFSSDQTLLDIHKSVQSVIHYAVTDLGSITFGSINSPEVSITYNNSVVTISNPYQHKGINITVAEADVVVHFTLADTEINYVISGATSDGSLKIYGNNKYILTLNRAAITNNDGPTINIQSTKKCTLTLASGTTSTLADGSSYASGT